MAGGHRYEEMLSEEFLAEQERVPVAYFACGSLKEHGLHLPLGTDVFVAHAVCLRAAEVVGGIVYPPIPFAPMAIPGRTREELRSGKVELYKPSLWVSRDASKRLFTELLESLADLGFRACIGFGGHHAAGVLLQEILSENGGVIRGMRFWGGAFLHLLGDLLIQEGTENPTALGHAMLWETSLVMAVRPDLVDTARAPRVLEWPLPSQAKVGGQHRIDRLAEASAEMGEAGIARMVEAMERKARELLSA